MRETIEERVEKLKSKTTKREFCPGKWYIRLYQNRAHLMKKAGFYELPNFLETECGDSMPMNGDTLECDPTYPEWKKCPDCRALSETEPTFDGLMAILRRPSEIGGANANA